MARALCDWFRRRSSVSKSPKKSQPSVALNEDETLDEMEEEKMSHFDESFEHVIGVEGGYVNNPFDHGGPTNWGITQDTLASFRGKPVTAKDVQNLSQHEAKLIYRARYWNPLGCEEIESSLVASLLFDQGVNRGIGAAARSMQAMVLVNIDGMIGPKTIAKINSMQPNTLAFKFVCDAQEAYARIVQKNTSQAVFLVGWLRRTHKLFDQVFRA